LKKVKYCLVCFFYSSKKSSFPYKLDTLTASLFFALSDLLGVFKEAYQMGAMLFSYSMLFVLCQFFALLTFLGGKLIFQFGPTLDISDSLPFKDKYLISTLIPTNVDQDSLEKNDASPSSL
jgi:hypothetical protein